MPKPLKERSLSELDDFLAQGGFTRAKRPKGALARHRAQAPRIPQPMPSKPSKPKAAPKAVGIEVLQAEWKLDWLVHGFSTRAGGRSTVFGRNQDLNLGFSKHDARETVEKNRKAF